MARANKTRAPKPNKGKGAERRYERKDANPVLEVDMAEFAKDQYERYGLFTLESRAIPDYRDGFKPSTRRLLWSAHTLGFNHKAKLVKAMRIVGDTIGRFHPHGDASAYSSMVSITNVGVKVNNIRHALIQGGGNWGSLVDSRAAAARYTEARLSKLSDEMLFNKFYMPAMQRVHNFDNTTEEPLVLPALLPQLFLNGDFGIAAGASARSPLFEADSLIDLLELAYKGEELTSKLLAKTLRVTNTYGGVESKASAKSEGRKALFSDKKGSIELDSVYTYDEKKRALTFTGFANTDFAKILTKVPTIMGVHDVWDASSPECKFGKIVVVLKKQADNRHKRTFDAVVKFMRGKVNYQLNFTRRYIDKDGQASSKMRAMTLPEVMTSWVKWRVALEKKACNYWIGEDEKEIKRIMLLMQACDMIDFIMALLKDKKLKSSGAVYEAYAKKAKIDLEQAKYVMNRPIISLRSLSKADLIEEKKKVESNKAKLQHRHDKPRKYMIRQLADFRPLLQGN